MATIGDLAAPMIHKINNDMGAIRVIAQSLFEQCLNERNKLKAKRIVSRADRILQGAQRLSNWIQQQPQSLTMNKVLYEARDRVNISPLIKVNIDLPQNLPMVLAGEQQLTDVFDNLIQNAVDAMPMGGMLSIKGESLTSLHRSGDIWVKIHISDTGKGIEKGDYEKIFKAGFRPTSNKRGMGFGLWWTRAYVERVGGYITLESEVGKGAQFTVVLPANRPGSEI